MRSITRHLTILGSGLVLAVSTMATVTRAEPERVSATRVAATSRQNPPIDSVVQFLLAATATDFHTHRPPDPARFRKVRFGHVATPSGEKRYMLCGEFLPAQRAGKTEWTPFVTIKTSGYEQWVGAQAAGYCRNSAIIWDQASDLSRSLRSRLDSLRKSRE